MTLRRQPGTTAAGPRADVLDPAVGAPARSWPIAIAVAVVIIGPGLLPGALFNLDLVLVPDLDVPAGFWGLGPELPRRLPLWVPIAALSPLVPATITGKLLMIGVFVGAFTGAARLVGRVERSWALMAGALYAFSPFLITRTAVGHFMIMVPYAVLPWVLPTLLRPGRRLDRTFLAALALGAGGHFGGTIALVVVIVGILCKDHSRWLKALGVTLAAQAPWIVPGLLVSAITSSDPADSSAFPTAAAGVGGLLRLSAGGGFWNTYFQAGGTGFVGAVVGALLLCLAAYGSPELPEPLRRPLVVLGVLGWLVPASSALPGLQQLFEMATDNPVGLIWREGHRVLVLHLIWLAPAAVLGARRLARADTSRPAFVCGMAGVLPAAVAVTLTIPSLWGIGGQLEATSVPPTWEQARRLVREDPGTVLALPWNQYFNLQLGDADAHRVLNPLPLFLGGDVLASTDNQLQVGVSEGTDPREGPATAVVERLETGDHVADELVELGVRWIVRVKRPDVDEYAALRTDPDLEMRIDGEDLAVFEVVGWHANAVSTDGQPAEVVTLVPGLATSSLERDLVWYRAGSAGWMRGGSTAAVTANGLLAVPGGSGPIWQLATPVALVGQVMPMVAAVALIYRLRRRSPDR